jgi:hypothetical protein
LALKTTSRSPRTAEADLLARRLAQRALPAFRRAAARIPDLEVKVWDPSRAEESTPPRSWPRHGTELIQITPETIEQHIPEFGHQTGLPLTLASAPPLAQFLKALILERRQRAPNTAVRRELGEYLVKQEARLWALAAGQGAPSDVLPYATRIRALRWWWLPRPNQNPLQAPLCLRCGKLTASVALDQAGGAPICDHCRRNPTLTHSQAIAPAGPGTWWLRCQAIGCGNASAARAHARRCPACKLASTTPSRRRPLRAQHDR